MEIFISKGDFILKVGVLHPRPRGSQTGTRTEDQHHIDLTVPVTEHPTFQWTTSHRHGKEEEYTTTRHCRVENETLFIQTMKTTTSTFPLAGERLWTRREGWV